jgi:DNA-binding NarL/FixJ family response regulator
MKGEITIVVVDDHPLFRQGVVDILSSDSDFKVIGQAQNGVDAVDLIRNLTPAVAVVDINLPGLNGQQVVRQINQDKIPTRVVLLTAYDDHEQIINSARAGASAYCAKDVDPQQLMQIIREVTNGKYFFDDNLFTLIEFKKWLANELEKNRNPFSDPGNPFHPLSNREMEVLSWVVKGNSNKEIASNMGISQQTVKNHVTSILRKFGVEDRTQAVVFALKQGWVSLYEKDQPSEEK